MSVAVEGEHQQITRYGCRCATQHDHPVDGLLAGIEAPRRGMIVADDAAAFLDPPDVGPGRNIPRDPHQEHQHDAQREGEAQIVVRVLGPLRPGREHLRPEPWRQQFPAEGNVEARQGEHDEAARRHPVHETLEGVEAHQRAARPPVLDTHHAADQIEQDKHREHAEDGNSGDPAERHLVELAPIAAGGLLQHARPGIRKRAAPLDLVQLLQKLTLLDRLRHRIDFGRLFLLLRHNWGSKCCDQTERQSADQQSKPCAHRRHHIISLFPASPDGWVIEATG